MANIVAWAQSKHGFYVDRHYIDGRWILRPGPIRLADYHAKILDHLFTPDGDGRLSYDVIAWCEPAKSGKSALAGLCALYAALHLDKNSQVVMASNNQRQAASIMFKSLTDSIDLSPFLHVKPGREQVEFRNGNTCLALPSNSRGAAGARWTFVAFDELWGYIHQDATRLWSEFKTDPTRQHSIKLAVGYAGYTGESDLWLDTLNTGLAGEPVPELADITNPDGEPACWRNGRHFTFWSHQCRQPWQTEAWIDAQRKTLRAAEFSRMILTEFAEGEGDFIAQPDWELLIDPNHRPLPPGSSIPVYVGLDLATAPGGDDCALIGLYAEGGKALVAFHKLWRGTRKTQLKLSESVYPYLVRANDDYNLTGVWFDPFQALYLVEKLQQAGLHCHPVQQTFAGRGPKDTTLFQLASNRQLVLYDHPELRYAAAGASAKELGNGLIFLKKAGGRLKIDLLVALSNVADEALPRKKRWRDIEFLSLAGGEQPVSGEQPTESAWQQLARQQGLDPRTGVSQTARRHRR